VGSHHVGAWRKLYAHLMAEMGWAEFSMNFAQLELFADVARRPRATLDVTSHFVHQITKNQTESQRFQRLKGPPAALTVLSSRTTLPVSTFS
jgi:hypothetical protein